MIMKKKFLIALFCLGFFASTNVPDIKGEEGISMYCVGTCLGTFCYDKFKDQQKAIDFIDAAENYSDAVNDLVVKVFNRAIVQGNSIIFIVSLQNSSVYLFQTT